MNKPDFQNLVSAAQSRSSALAFLTSDSFAVLASSLLAKESDAARFALHASDSGKDPRQTVSTAIGYLKPAHINLSRVLHCSYFYMGFNPNKILLAAKKEIWICALLALCHLYLEEKEQALALEEHSSHAEYVIDFLDESAEDNPDLEHHLLSLGATFRVLTGNILMNWITILSDIVRDVFSNPPRVEYSKIQEFWDAIKRS